MRIACVGGGPAGLYFAVLAKRAQPAHEIAVFERNRADDTFGFGVVFSDNTMGFLSEQDRRSYPEIMAQSLRWDPITLIHQGRAVRCGGVGFSAIERRLLLRILQEQARSLGVELHFQAEVTSLDAVAGYDLVLAGDGVNSTLRSLLAERVQPRIELGPTRFVWLGTTKGFDSLTFFFERSEHGWFGVHVYPYRRDRSTFIVETDEETWLRAGMDAFSEADTIAYCERLFAAQLEGGHLLSNRSLWTQFRTLQLARWHWQNVVFLGDAAHTAHFSVGSGTKMAMEDALALSQAIARFPRLPEALAAFEEERRPRVEHIQRMAAQSFEWWATFRHYAEWPAERLSFHTLTRALFRADILRTRDPGYLERVELASGIELRQRLVALAPPEAGDEEVLALLDEAPLVLTQELRRPGLAQRAHAAGGRLGLHLWAPGADDLVEGARRAQEAGFDVLQLQFGHGSFFARLLSPLTNPVPLDERLRIPLSALERVRTAWTGPLWVCFSATDWAPGGTTAEDAMIIARAFREHGSDLLTVVGGQTTDRSTPPYGRCFNAPLAGRIRNEAGVPVMAQGGITDLDDARTVLLAGRADYVLLASVRLGRKGR